MKLLIANKELADALKSWLSVIAVFFAAGYSLLEYIEHKQAVKVERSLGYVEHYRDSSTAEAKLALNQLIADHQNSLTELLNKNYKDETKLNIAYNQLILNMTKTPIAQRNLEVAFSFFEEAAICVEKNLCDADVISSFFLNDAKALFNSFYPYVCSLRSQWKNETVYLKLEEFYVKPTQNPCRLN